MQTNKGFTIIETLVAATILVIGFVAPITVAVNSMRATSFAIDQAAAYYFATEGIEMVRAARDNAVLEGLPNWLEYLDNCIAPAACSIRDPSGSIDNDNDFENGCASGGCSIRYSGGQNRFMSAGGPATKFSREIVVTPIPGGREADIQVSIFWETIGESHSLVVRERIFNWSGN